jgi:hypothetical protein
VTSFSAKVRRLGYIPWILLAPPAGAAVLILLCVLIDRVFLFGEE